MAEFYFSLFALGMVTKALRVVGVLRVSMRVAFSKADVMYLGLRK